MRIAYYSPYLPPSFTKPIGDVTVARNVISALESRGHEVLPISGLQSGDVLGSPGAIPGAVSAGWRAYRRARQFQPDLWLTAKSGIYCPDLLGPVLAPRLGARYVLYGRLTRDPSDLRGDGVSAYHLRAGTLLDRRALRAADRLIVYSRADVAHYGRDPLLRQRLVSLLPPVVTDRPGPDPAVRAATRRRWGVPEAACVVLSVSRLGLGGNARKAESVRLLIDSFSAFVREAPDDDQTLLWIIGEGKSRPGLEAHARHLGWRVRFLSAVAREQLGEFYNAADVFAFPGLREPLGMVFLEAQAWGLPVVAFRNGGVPDAVVDGRTGLLVEPADRAAFTAALTRVIREPGLRRSLGEAATGHVHENCEPGRWADAFLAVAHDPTSIATTVGAGLSGRDGEPVGSEVTVR